MFFPFKPSAYIPFICAKMKETVETFLVLVPTSFLQWAYYGVDNLPNTGIRKTKMMTREGRRKLTRHARGVSADFCLLQLRPESTYLVIYRPM